jgi:hypothetical protein
MKSLLSSSSYLFPSSPAGKSVKKHRNGHVLDFYLYKTCGWKSNPLRKEFAIQTLDFRLLTPDSSITRPTLFFRRDWKIGEVWYLNIYPINLSFVLFLFVVFAIGALQSEVYRLTF